MLVKLTDHKGREYAVNPLYIKSILEKKPGVIEVYGSFTGPLTRLVLKGQSVDDVCDRVSIALTSIGAPVAGVIDDQNRQQQVAAGNPAVTAAAVT